MDPFENRRGRIAAMADRLRPMDRFLILPHIRPDGDALGSILALTLGLKALGKETTVFCPGDVPETLKFLPGLELAAEEPGNPEDYDTLILVDCHSLDRAGDECSRMASIPVKAVIDHHLTDDPRPADVPEELFIIDTGASAAGEIVYQLLTELGVEITTAMATNLFVAIATDTGSFAYDNTTTGALKVSSELVAAGAAPWDVHVALRMNRSPNNLHLLGHALKEMEFHYDGRVGVLTVTQDMMAAAGGNQVTTDGFVEYPRSVRGVELAILFREKTAHFCEVSLRSRGKVNAAALARTFGGGGHANAAGFSVNESLDYAKEQVLLRAGPFLVSEKIEGSR